MIIDPNLSTRNKRIAAIWCRATSNHAVLGNLEVDPLCVTMVDSHGKAVHALALKLAHSAEVDDNGDDWPYDSAPVEFMPNDGAMP